MTKKADDLHTSDEPERRMMVDDTPHAQESRSLLVADYEDFARDPIVAILERSGYHIFTAKDCPEAVSLFREHADTIVAVLLDYSMPGGKSDDVFESIQRIRPNIPVIMMSGYAEEDVIGRFKGMGIVGFLHKPFGRIALLDMVRDAIEPPAA